MPDETLDHYIDREKITADTKFLLDEIGKGVAAIADANSAKKTIQGATSSKGIAEGAELGIKANARLTESVKAVNAVIQQRFASEAKLVTVTTDYNKATIANRVELQKTNKELKAQAEAETAVIGSRARASAQIKVLTGQKDKLNLLNAEEKQQYDEIVVKIEKYNSFLVKTGTIREKQAANVGNYQGSAKLIVDALEKEKIKLQSLTGSYQNFGAQVTNARTIVAGFGAGAAKGDTQKFENEIKSATVEMTKLETEIEQSRTKIEGFNRITSQPNFLNVAGKVGDANQELKFFTKSLIDLERQGLGNSEAANALRKSLATLTDQVSDAKAEIKALSSDTRGFDLFASSVSFAADAFQTFAGAAVLAGASEEDAAEATRTLVAVQSVANGVKGIANELTTRGTAANKVYAFAQRNVALAMDGTATAGARLRGVLVTLGIGAVIVGIGLLIANFSKIKETLTGVTGAQKAYTDTLADYKKGAQEAIEKTRGVKLAFDEAKAGVISKDAALKIYNESLGDTFGKATSLAEAEKLYNEKAGDYIKIMGLKAQANALFALSAETMAKGLVAANEDQVNLWDEFKQSLTRESFFSGVTAEQRAKIQADKVKAIQEKAAADSLAIDQKAEKLAFEADTRARDRKLALDPDKDPKVKAKKDTSAEDALKAAIEAEKKKSEAIKSIALARANELIRINQAVVDSDGSSFKEKLAALETISTQRKRIAAIEYADAVASETKIEGGKKIVIDKSEKEIEAATLTHTNKLKLINDDLLKGQVEAQKANTLKIIAEYDKIREAKILKLDQETQAIRDNAQKSFNEEVIALNARLQNGTISQEAYNKKRAKLEIDYQFASLQREIDYQNELIKISDLPADKKAEALQKLSELERQLSDATRDNHIKNEQEKLAATLKTLDQVSSTANTVFGLIDGLLNANAVSQKNKLQAQQEEAEKKAARDIELVNASTLSEQDKAAKITVINARLAAQKDQIARKEKQADLDRARFAKAAAIFNIILSTTQAVIKAYADGKTYAEKISGAILAGVAGAAQLAIAIATPIPKFIKGKNLDNYEGLAIVNEVRDEVIEREDGTIEFPQGRNVLTYAGKRDIIHPDKDAWLNAILNAAHRDANAGMKIIPAKNAGDNLTLALEKQTKSIVSAIQNKREITIKGISGKDVIFRDGSSTTTYLNQHLQ